MKKNWILILFVVILAIFQLVLTNGAEFGGTDGEAEAVIIDIQAEYDPWFSPIWEPPSGEIESVLFALQAVAGTSFIAYYFGFKKGQQKVQK